ncbi:MAG: hypothetical protein JSV04_08430 [Candidatus Heimdallarchaeota archaeon]|nr:MAG: hypothetical protein JSV04_08430 [Candidatus Heimdallarchaeota archaeon]
MKIRTFVFSIYVVIFLTGLGAVGIPYHSSLSRSTLTVPSGEEFCLKFGESVNFQDIPLTITFTDVIEEARCPEDVICFWAGFVTVQVLVGFHNSSNFYNLTLGLESSLHWINLTLSTSTCSIRLVAVDPLPISTHQTPKSDYNISLILTAQDQDTTNPPLTTSLLPSSTTPLTVTSDTSFSTSESPEIKNTTQSKTTATLTPGFIFIIPFFGLFFLINAFRDKRGKRK